MSKIIYDLDLTDLDIDPAEIIRGKRAEKIFGYKHTQLNEKVRTGQIEPPFLMSEDGIAVGWTGAQCIRHHRKRIAATLKKLKIA